MTMNNGLTTHRLTAAALLAVLAFALTGCNRQESAADVAEDMSEQRREGNEQVREAQEDAAANLSDSAEQLNADAARIEMEKIRADYEVAKERCDGIPEDTRENCRKDAQATFDRRMNELRAMHPAAADTAAPPALTSPP